MEKPTAKDDALIIGSTWCQVIINFIVLAKQTSSTKHCQRPSQAEGKTASWHLFPIELSPLIYSSYIPLVSVCCLSTSLGRTNLGMHEVIQINVFFSLLCLNYHIYNTYLKLVCCAEFCNKIVHLLLSSTKKKSTRIKCISIKWLEWINYTSVGGRWSMYHHMALKKCRKK